MLLRYSTFGRRFLATLRERMAGWAVSARPRAPMPMECKYCTVGWMLLESESERSAGLAPQALPTSTPVHSRER